MKESIILLLLAGLFAVGLSGCNDASTAPESNSRKESQNGTQNAPPQVAAPVHNGSSSLPGQPAVQPARPDGSPAEATQSGTSEEKKAQSMEPNELLHRRFILETADGVDFSSKDRPLEIEFRQSPTGKGFMISGGICNRFTGQGNLQDGVLSAPHLGMTRMLCPEEDLNRLENLFAQMMMEGAHYTLKDGQLILRYGEHELVYSQADWVN